MGESRQPSKQPHAADASALAPPTTIQGLTPTDQAAAVQPTPARPLPRKIGRFEIRELLGEGTFGSVYRAHDPKLDREVAVKVPKGDTLASEADRLRFLREARAAGALQHPNICPIHEVISDLSVMYIVMAYVPGKSLFHYLRARKTPLSPRQAAIMVRKLALALFSAHAKGIVHRDLKPGNILFDQERKDVVITDFGLARRIGAGEPELTREGDLLGTPAYMSPEQAAGSTAIGPATDIYSLGVILYELLTGVRPFQGKLAEVLAKVKFDTPTPASQVKPGLDARLDAICMKALAKKPAERFASMKEFAQALGDYLKESAGPAKGQAEPSDATQIADVVAALNRAETKTVERSQYVMLASIGCSAAAVCFLGVVALTAIWLFTRGGDQPKTVTVTLQNVTYINDITVNYFLDGDKIESKKLKGPLELRVGEHELDAKRVQVLLERRRFHVGPEHHEKAIVLDEKMDPRVNIAANDKDGKKPPVKKEVPIGDRDGKKEPVKEKVSPFADVKLKPTVLLGQSPMDKLDPKAIPADERFLATPKELVAVIGEHRQRNWGRVLALSVRPNGKEVATYGHNEQGIWAIPSGKMLQSSLEREGWWFHPDGKHLFGSSVWDVSGETPIFVGKIPGTNTSYCSSRDGTLLLGWGPNVKHVVLLDCSDLANIKEVAKIADATTGALSHNGKVLAVSGDASVVRIMEWTGKEVKFRYELPLEFNVHGHRTSFAPDGRLGVCHMDGSFRLWDVSGIEPNVVAGTPKIDASWGVFSQDGKRVALATDKHIEFWRIDGNKLDKTCSLPPRRLPESYPLSAAFLPAGDRVVTGHLNGIVHYWDITGPEAKEINPINGGLSPSIEISPNGKWLLAWTESGHLTRYGFGNTTPQQLAFGAEFVSWHGGGNRIASDTSVVQIGAKFYRLLDELTEVSPPVPGASLVDVNSNGVALFTKDKTMALVNLIGKPEKLTDWVEGPSGPCRYRIAPDGRQVLCYYEDQHSLSLWCHSERKLTKMSQVRIPAPDLIREMTFTPDGKTVAAFPRSGSVMLYAVSGAILEPIIDTSYTCDDGGGCFSPDGKQLATCWSGNRVCVYAFPSARQRHIWQFPGPVRRVLYAPDGRHLLVNGFNGVVYILRLEPEA